MKVKAVFHIKTAEEQRLTIALNNMANLIKEVPQLDSEVCLVSNGHGVKLFQKEYLSDYAIRLMSSQRLGFAS
jgi:intracellular sulfur oxidation DsrE/DsrF family protein